MEGLKIQEIVRRAIEPFREVLARATTFVRDLAARVVEPSMDENLVRTAASEAFDPIALDAAFAEVDAIRARQTPMVPVHRPVMQPQPTQQPLRPVAPTHPTPAHADHNDYGPKR